MADLGPRLLMRGVRKRFGATLALAGVDFEVSRGEVHALVGENGAGKSTLMRVLSGALRADAGEMRLDGRPYTPRTPADGRRAGVGMIYQELSLAPHLSVTENLMLGVEPCLGPLIRRRAMRRRAAEAMQSLGRADVPLDAPVGALSTAAQQLVEIGRSLVAGCRVLVLDEPTSSLTSEDAERLFALIRRMRDAGTAVVYISHALEEVQAISDRYTVLRDGASVGGGPTAGSRLDEMIALMVGRRVSELYPRSRRSPGEVVLDVGGLCGRRMPVDASFKLRRGEVLGIAGLVGAGRTELLRAVFGLDAVVRGEVRVALAGGPARPGRRADPALRWRQGVGIVSEDRKNEGLALGLSVSENLCLPALRRVDRAGLLTRAALDVAARSWLRAADVRCASPRQPAGDLSGGNQQKVALARLLHADVDVLLLDEPARGIDVGAKAHIYRLIDALAVGDAAGGRKPRAVLIVSSYVPELLGVCDRVAVMRRGRLGPFREAGALDEHAILREATGAGAGSDGGR